MGNNNKPSITDVIQTIFSVLSFFVIGIIGIIIAVNANELTNTANGLSDSANELSKIQNGLVEKQNEISENQFLLQENFNEWQQQVFKIQYEPTYKIIPSNDMGYYKEDTDLSYWEFKIYNVGNSVEWSSAKKIYSYYKITREKDNFPFGIIGLNINDNDNDSYTTFDYDVVKVINSKTGKYKNSLNIFVNKINNYYDDNFNIELMSLLEIPYITKLDEKKSKYILINDDGYYFVTKDEMQSTLDLYDIFKKTNHEDIDDLCICFDILYYLIDNESISKE